MTTNFDIIINIFTYMNFYETYDFDCPNRISFREGQIGNRAGLLDVPAIVLDARNSQEKVMNWGHY